MGKTIRHAVDSPGHAVVSGMAGVLLVLAGASSINVALAADVERGRTLYETRCNVCHATGVHIRQSRKAVNFDGIREQVVRWNRELGGTWGADEIDDVSVFINGRYYFYRCPEIICRPGPANAG